MGRKARLEPQRSAILDGEVRLGRIDGVFALKGEVRLYLYNRESDLFKGDGVDITLVSKAGKRLDKRLRSRKGTGKRVLGMLNGVETPEQASELVGSEIVCAREAVPELNGDEYYHRDLIGLTVHRQSGDCVGRISEIVSSGVDFWVVATDGPEIVFPATKDVVLSVDLHAGVTVVDDAGEVL